MGIITGKLKTAVSMELFFTWCPIAEIKVKQFDILNEPINKSVIKNE
tara:strand:+ start:861 stop:1001 length:141 start_codon:yes stop_codon:yes gene_type:complete